MGKGSKPRPVSKNYGKEMDRIFGKRCIKHRKVECPVCSTPKPAVEQAMNIYDTVAKKYSGALRKLASVDN